MKEVRSELRTKHALATMGLFALATLMVVSYSLGQADFPLSNGPRSRILAALLWIVLFFSAMAGLARVFVKEEDARTVTALRLSARASVVYAGKLLFNAGLMAALAVVVLPLFGVLFAPILPQRARWDQVVLLVALGGMGLTGASTLLAALVAKTGTRGSLFVVLVLPVLLPLLVMAMAGTAAALEGRHPLEAWRNLVGLIAYTVATVTASAMLFPFVWDE